MCCIHVSDEPSVKTELFFAPDTVRSEPVSFFSTFRSFGELKSKRGDWEKRGDSGAATQSPKSSRKHDPCSLVTKEEMSQASGEQFTEAKAEDNSNRCVYMSADASVASAREISSSWDGIESWAMGKREFPDWEMRRILLCTR